MTARRFVYCAWLENLGLPSEDEDHEWPAVFIIEAETAGQALEWGDVLARRYCERWDDQAFLRSYVYVEEDEPAVDHGQLPSVAFGYEASDEEIGW